MTVKIKHNKGHVLYKALGYDHCECIDSRMQWLSLLPRTPTSSPPRHVPAIPAPLSPPTSPLPCTPPFVTHSPTPFATYAPLRHARPPPTEFLTHACENITFPQLLLRTVTTWRNVKSKTRTSSFEDIAVLESQINECASFCAGKKNSQQETLWFLFLLLLRYFLRCFPPLGAFAHVF